MSDLFERCPLCSKEQFKSSFGYQGRDAFLIECPVCGTYSISRTAAVGLKDSRDGLLAWLSCHTRQVWESDGRPYEILTTNWRSTAESHAASSLGQRLDKLIRLAERRTPEPGLDFEVDREADYPLVDCTSVPAFRFMLDHAAEVDFIRFRGGNQYLITFAGWEYIERTGLSSTAPARVFVAMSFDDAMDPAYLEGIKPAVELDCGFVCINLKHLLHNDDITDRMLAEIRRCQILVADFTQQKHGVYYEAGFALALGREVIWCVRKDEMSKVHFDTNHRAHITWETPAELRTRLAAFIQAKFQDAVNRSHAPSR